MSDTNSIKKIDLNKTDWRTSRDFFQSLEDELRKLDEKDEKYDFTWVGKRKAILEAGAPINKTLRPDKKSSKNWNTTQNLFIEGDNLDALKLLQESYLGKIKMIYIDPPYNTGKDFVYHDNFRVSMEEYDESTEYKDEEGNIQYKKNEKSNGRYHSDWLSMMYPRLKLARNLLSDDGVIFISIDDNEQSNLKKLCDEVYGEENHVITFYIQVRYEGKTLVEKNDYQKLIEQVLVYKKSYKFNPIKPSEDYSVEKFCWNIIEIGVGTEIVIKGKKVRIFKPEEYKIEKVKPNLKALKETWASGTVLKGNASGKFFGDNLAPRKQIDGLNILYKVEGIGEDGLGYRYFSGPKQEKATKGKFYSGIPLSRLEELENGGSIKEKSISNLYNFAGDFGNCRLEGGVDFRAVKKPIKFLQTLISQVVKSDTDIVLDFFGGSGSTSHAVMDFNAKNGINAKFITVQLPEVISEDDKEQKDYFNFLKGINKPTNIAELCKERIRRSGEQIAKEHPDAKVDYGFRSLVIADTNYKEIYKPVSEYKQESLLDGVDNIKEDRTDLDLLFGVLIQLALELNRPIETCEIEESTVYLYDYLGEVSGIVACFSEQISDEAIKQIAKLKPLTAVFRESSFADSQAKVNLAEHFRVLSPDTKVRVI